MLGLSPNEFERRTAAAARQVQGEARGVFHDAAPGSPVKGRRARFRRR